MQTVPLTTLMANLDSGARPPGGAGSSSDGVPSLGAEHLADDGGFFLDNLKTVPEFFFNEMTKGHICKDDILIVKDGATTGKASFVNGTFPFMKAAVNEHVFRLTIDKAKADPAYVFRFIGSDTGKRQVLKDFRGATVGGISRGFTEMVQVPIPFPNDPRRSLAEQKRIAAILDKADAIRRRRQDAVRLVRDLRTSLLLETIGDPILNKRKWTMKPFEEVLSSDRPITYGILKPGDHHPEGVPMVRIQDVSEGEIVEQSLHRVSPELSEQYRRTILMGGEIVISLVGTIGVVGRVPKSLAGANLHRNLGLVVPSPDVNDEYLYELMLSPVFKLMLVTSTKGGIQSLLNLGDLSKVKVPVPPRELQDRFASQVLAIRRRLKSAVAAALQGETLFNSLVQRAFRGEL